MEITEKQLEVLNTKKGLLALLDQENILDAERAVKAAKQDRRLEKLQVELIKLQNWVVANKKRVIIIFEGRDAAGKGGAIRRITENMNPREHRIVALPKPNEVEAGQWYFQRYIHQLPRAGEIVFFDRSWYNRAVVEPVNGFCTDAAYKLFMEQVNEFEKMIITSGAYLLKLYFSITKEEQEKRFREVMRSPLKKWKYSAVDKKALELWDKYTYYKEEMFRHTDTLPAPWKTIKANRKGKSRIEALEYILEQIPYQVKDPQVLIPEVIE
jgi:polyphosphate kinase 2